VIDRATVERWLADYVAAWKSYDREAIAALYTEDAECRYHPYDEPIRGRDAIVESWFGQGDSAPSRDPKGTYDATFHPVAIDGDLAVAVGASSYTDPAVVYDNCFLIRFDAHGRCREFTEWFMQRPTSMPGHA
jgi:ketosteroid isomerase-like protein